MFNNFVKTVTHYMEKNYTREEAIKMAREDLTAMWDAFFVTDTMDGYDADGEEIKVSMDDYFPEQLYIYSERKAQEERLDKFEANERAKLEAEKKTETEISIGKPEMLCLSCAKDYPECDAAGSDMKYAPGSDTIVECSKFEKKPDLLEAARVQSDTLSNEQKTEEQ